MDEQMTAPALPRSGIKRYLTIAWLMLQYGFDRAMDLAEHYYSIMRREAELFLGTAFALIGAFSFQNGKNCDGNTADYLSCTRPSTFYYYGALEIFLIVVGVFLIMLWYLQHKHTHDRRAQ